MVHVSWHSLTGNDPAWRLAELYERPTWIIDRPDAADDDDATSIHGYVLFAENRAFRIPLQLGDLL